MQYGSTFSMFLSISFKLQILCILTILITGIFLLFIPYSLCIFCLKGGLDLKMQEAALRRGPDIVIATPGRLIDHLHNAPHFSLHSVEILVLDEADR